MHGIAGLEVGIPADGTLPLDGVDAWPSITSTAPSTRTQMLLQLNPSAVSGELPQAAIRVGKYKLIVGKPAVFGAGSKLYSSDHCSSRDDHVSPTTFPYQITNTTSPAFCCNGWVPPPETGQLPVPPPDVSCSGDPCYFPNTSYTNGGFFLYDIDADPTEKLDLAAAQPDTVQLLMAALQVYVNKSIPQDHPSKDANSTPAMHGGVWTPWVGDPDPTHCAPVPIPPVPPPKPCGGDGSIGESENLQIFGNGTCRTTGWCSGPNYGGLPRAVEALIDGTVVATALANGPRKIAGLHGFDVTFKCGALASGDHKVTVACKCADPSLPPQPIDHQGVKGPTCTHGPPAHVVPCPSSLQLPMWHIQP